jgi:glycosyltransferase involved in cell wall biosynthesis
MTKVPTVYTVHGYHFLDKSLRLVRWLALNAERMAGHRADRVIFVSNNDARIAQDYGLLADPKQGVVIYNSASLAEIPRAKPSESKHIGFIGRLEYPKDPLLFLEVLERLPGHTATIVGGGALEDEVRAKIERLSLCERVRMLGPLPYRETLSVLSSLSAVVLTSRWEGLPHSPLEAMVSGVPVVATNVGGLNEVIESGRSGLLVERRSADDLARAVMQVTEDAALREHIIENGRARVHALFSEEQMLSGIHKVYRRMAHGED